jgi:hypothetical protein
MPLIAEIQRTLNDAFEDQALDFDYFKKKA